MILGFKPVLLNNLPVNLPPGRSMLSSWHSYKFGTSGRPSFWQSKFPPWQHEDRVQGGCERRGGEWRKGDRETGSERRAGGGGGGGGRG
eukprot:759001-Hanusia_phi.AAC.6